MTFANIAATEPTITALPDFIVEGVPQCNVPVIWEVAWPLLKKAIDRVPVRRPKSKRQVFSDLLAKRAQLWIAWDVEKHECAGAILTEVTTSREHPGKRFMEVPLVGGRDFRGWVFPIWRLLKEWGRANGCTHAVGYGRKGWMRLLGFDEYGKTPEGILIMVYDLKEH